MQLQKGGKNHVLHNVVSILCILGDKSAVSTSKQQHKHLKIVECLFVSLHLQ